jgi:hypothetical protein
MAPEIGRAEDAQTTPETFLCIYARERRGCRVRFLAREDRLPLVSGPDWCRALGVPFPEIMAFFHAVQGRAFKLEGVWWWTVDLAYQHAGQDNQILDWLADRIHERPELPTDPFMAMETLIFTANPLRLLRPIGQRAGLC